LRIILEAVHDAQARIEIVDRPHALDALADVSRAACGLRQLLENAMRKEMTERVDVLHCPWSPAGVAGTIIVGRG